MAGVDEAKLLRRLIPAVDEVDGRCIDPLGLNKHMILICFQKFPGIVIGLSSFKAKSVRFHLPRLLFHLCGSVNARGRGGVNASGLMPANPSLPHAQIFFPQREGFHHACAFFNSPSVQKNWSGGVFLTRLRNRHKISGLLAGNE